MESIFVISMIVFSIHYTMQEGEILGIAQRINLGWFANPLRDCPVCMVPWYGTVIYLLLGYHPVFSEWAVVIFSSMGLNAVINKLINGSEVVTAALDDQTTEAKIMHCESLKISKEILKMHRFNYEVDVASRIIKSADEIIQKLKDDTGTSTEIVSEGTGNKV